MGVFHSFYGSIGILWNPKKYLNENKNTDSITSFFNALGLYQGFFGNSMARSEICGNEDGRFGASQGRRPFPVACDLDKGTLYQGYDFLDYCEEGERTQGALWNSFGGKTQ
jgi:hypothetical protein